MISVCMATFQGAPYVEQQLTSILGQLAEDDEVVVSDDGSADNTIGIINKIGDPRVVWAGTSGGLGVVKNFERAMQRARGDYIFLADQDDIWLPGKVEACVQSLQEYLLVVTDCRVVDASLEEISPSFFDLRQSGPGLIKNLLINSYLGCCMAFRRELLERALPMPDNIPMHDMWLGLIAELKGNTCFLPAPYLLYRRHNATFSQSAGKSKYSFGRKIQFRLVLGWNILLRMLLRQ
jgi:glycosyltransferase involved in cell wall biosynthesis